MRCVGVWDLGFRVGDLAETWTPQSLQGLRQTGFGPFRLRGLQGAGSQVQCENPKPWTLNCALAFTLWCSTHRAEGGVCEADLNPY